MPFLVTVGTNGKSSKNFLKLITFIFMSDLQVFSMNVLTPMMIQYARTNKVHTKMIFVDFVASKVYTVEGFRVEPEMEAAVMEIAAKKTTIPKIDDETIRRLEQKKLDIKSKIESNNGTQ
jgi:hypothetical protein